MKRIVLAYSGSAATSAAIPWLIEQHQAEVVTVTLDVGQGVELAHLRERALAAGAVRAHVIDAREEFVRQYVLPALRSGAFADPAAFSSTAQTRQLVARRLVELARMEATSAVAHGCSCDDPDRLSLEEAIRGIASTFEVLAPACEWQMSPAQIVEYARSRRIAVASPGSATIDANLLGRTIYGVSPSYPYKLTRSVDDAPLGAAYIDLEFLNGTPIKANDVDMSAIEIIESIETIAGTHAVGRVALDADVVAESPAAIVLHVAFAALGPEGNGTVRLKLWKGTCEVVGSRPHTGAEIAQAAV
jgi:argininosuccinate synthase